MKTNKILIFLFLFSITMGLFFVSIYPKPVCQETQANLQGIDETNPGETLK